MFVSTELWLWYLLLLFVGVIGGLVEEFLDQRRVNYDDKPASVLPFACVGKGFGVDVSTHTRC